MARIYFKNLVKRLLVFLLYGESLPRLFTLTSCRISASTTSLSSSTWSCLSPPREFLFTKSSMYWVQTEAFVSGDQIRNTEILFIIWIWYLLFRQQYKSDVIQLESTACSAVRGDWPRSLCPPPLALLVDSCTGPQSPPSPPQKGTEQCGRGWSGWSCTLG